MSHRGQRGSLMTDLSFLRIRPDTRVRSGDGGFPLHLMRTSRGVDRSHGEPIASWSASLHARRLNWLTWHLFWIVYENTEVKMTTNASNPKTANTPVPPSIPPAIASKATEMAKNGKAR